MSPDLKNQMAQQQRDKTLWKAIKAGDPDKVWEALKAGATILKYNEDGLNAVHQAAAHGNVKILEIILYAKDAGGSVSKESAMPIHYAALGGHYDCCALLLRKRSAFNIFDRHGMTPLHYAAREGHAKIACLLVRHGALPGQANQMGMDAYQIAEAHGHKDMPRQLEAALHHATLRHAHLVKKARQSVARPSP